MGASGGLSGAAAGASAGSVFGPIGAGVGGVIGGVAGWIGEDSAANKNLKEQKELIDIQARKNEEAAKANQERNKEMWDYTNYENQRKHMENAGLNPALMYGQGGGGGTSSAGAQAQGVGLAQAQGGKLRLEQQALGLQLASMASQVKVNESTANKQNAEANKIAGVDTEEKTANIDKLIAETSNEKIKHGLIYSQTRVNDAIEELNRGKVEETKFNIQNLIKSIETMESKIRNTNIDSELKERTIDTEVKRSIAEYENTVADTFVKYSQGSLNKESAKAIIEQIKQKWQEIGISQSKKEQGWRSLEQESEKIYNSLKVEMEKIRLGDENVTKDYILGLGRLLMSIIK